MSPNEIQGNSQCIFCFKNNDESELISMNYNSLEIFEEIIEFEEIILNLLQCKVNKQFFNNVSEILINFNPSFSDE